MYQAIILHAKNCYTNIPLHSICPNLCSKLHRYTRQIIPCRIRQVTVFFLNFCITARAVLYSRTSFERPPILQAESGRSRQVAAHREPRFFQKNCFQRFDSGVRTMHQECQFLYHRHVFVLKMISWPCCV